MVMDGRVVAQLMWNRVTTSAKRQFGSADRLMDLVVVG
jgi:hypothetical protein